jgi:WD40 repeat protein
VAFAPGGALLAAGGDDRRVRFHALPDGAARGALTVAREPVFAVTFSPDGKTIATGSGDGKVRLWAVPVMR